jgi:hypothetical protein
VQLEQNAGFERRRTTVEIQFTAGNVHLQGTHSDRRAAGFRTLAQFNQLIGARNDLAETVAERLALTQSEQVLGGEMELSHDEAFVECDQRDTEAAENLVGARRT